MPRLTKHMVLICFLAQCGDVIGEPRWARVYDTMGSDPEIVGNNVKAYIQGLQGSDDGTGVITVAATIKHFPGGGANEDGNGQPYMAGKGMPPMPETTSKLM